MIDLKWIGIWLGTIAVAILLGFGWGKIQYKLGGNHVKALYDSSAKITKTLSTAATAKVVTQYVDRMKIVHDKGRTIIKKVPIYVTKKDDMACTINNGFVSLWNAANQMSVPDTAGEFNAAASSVKLSDVEAQHAKESESYQENYEKLIALQSWVVAQQKAYNNGR